VGSLLRLDGEHDALGPVPVGRFRDEMFVPDSLTVALGGFGKYFKYTGQNSSNPVQYLYTGRVNACRSGGCGITSENDKALDFEYFDYFILFDSTVHILMVKIFNYQATHGQEITSKSWLKQFKGYQGKRGLQVGKQIDAISGATISVYGITNDIQLKTQSLYDWLETDRLKNPIN